MQLRKAKLRCINFLLCTGVLCQLLVGCTAQGWHDVTPHYSSANPPARFEFRNLMASLIGIWGLADGSQLWGVGSEGTILHYSRETREWAPQSSGTAKNLYSIFGSGDGSQLWAVGSEGTILHYSQEAGKWEAQTSGTANHLYSIFSNSDGSQSWAVGSEGTILHYSKKVRKWELQTSGTANHLYSIFGNSDSSQLWAVGSEGAILHYSQEAGKWEAQTSGTANHLRSVFGNSDGSQLWAVGEAGTILHYSKKAGKWELQTSATPHNLYSIFGNSDGSQLWAAGEAGTILRFSKEAGKWELQTSGTANHLLSVFGNSDGSQLWAAGEAGTILHYSKETGKWELQTSGTPHNLYSVLGDSDGSQLWAAGDAGTILHYSKEAGRWESQTSGSANNLRSLFGNGDGSQLWAVGDKGTVLHYSKERGEWEPQTSETANNLHSIFGSSDGFQLWAVGDKGTILHYSKEAGKWEPQTSGTPHVLYSVFGNSGGSQLWAVGDAGTILRYSNETGKWEPQISGTANDLRSVFGNRDGSQLWAVGGGGTILHYSKEPGKWEPQISGTPHYLYSVFGNSDGSQLWAVGEAGTILHYSKEAGKWEPQTSGTANYLLSVFVNSDGSRLWAAGWDGLVCYGERKGFYPYVVGVVLTPTLRGAELQVRVAAEGRATEPLGNLKLYASSRHNFEAHIQPEEVKYTPIRPRSPEDPWVFDFHPADYGFAAGDQGYLAIELRQGDYKYDYGVLLWYDPYRSFREHWFAWMALALAGGLVAALSVLLFARPLWILHIYRRLKIYSVIEQIKIPGIGETLQFVLNLTVLPWFVTHRRTLDAWVAANRDTAAKAWDTNFKLPFTDDRELRKLDVPYVALPLQIEDAVPARLLPQPTTGELEQLLQGQRAVVEIIGPGGSGKTTLARQIGGLALAGGKPGGFKQCRLPIWIDEDTTDLWEVIKRKVASWFAEGELVEELLLRALIQKGLLFVIFDRVSEHSATTQTYLGKVHGSVRCNALVLTARQRIPMEAAEQRFVYPQALDSGTLLHFMTAVIQYVAKDDVAESKPFPTIKSQTDLGNRLADLITVRIGKGDKLDEIPVLPLPVVLFVSSAIRLMKEKRNLDEIPNSLPAVYADYLRRLNPKIGGTPNSMTDEDMLAVAKVLAKLAVGNDYIPREFTREHGFERLRCEVSGLPKEVDPLKRLTDNGVLLFNWRGATAVYRFALDPVAEFLAAEAHFDNCAGKMTDLEELLKKSIAAQGFYNALLLTIQARSAA